MVSFLVFVFLMNMVLYRPIRRMVAERQSRIDAQQQDIDRAEAEKSAAIEEFDSKILDARKLGRLRIQELKAAAYEQEKEMLQKATEDGAAQLQEFRARIQKDVAKAAKDLKGQVKTFSVDLAQKILGRTI
ncbi:MAG: ATP synthase F0 subunit B [Syntrophobacteraceae bacterium]|jgi:F-type H+-transporting ATPase subunit b|nr:ATP synthase F0 subunit B [Syntrophobacteraceae bacterium]